MKIFGLPGYHMSEPYILPTEAEEQVMRQHLEKHNLARLEGLT